MKAPGLITEVNGKTPLGAETLQASKCARFCLADIAFMNSGFDYKLQSLPPFGSRANNLEPTMFAPVILGKFSQLKPEFALAALGSIPQEYFKRGPGRPPSTTTHRERAAAL